MRHGRQESENDRDNQFFKGGVGKTTVTWCLADTLGRRVAGVVSGSEVCQRVTACVPVGRYAGR